MTILITAAYGLLLIGDIAAIAYAIWAAATTERETSAMIRSAVSRAPRPDPDRA